MNADTPGEKVRSMEWTRFESDDAEQRARIVASLDESLIVEAAAGTGKTTVLVNRLVSVLAEGKGEVAGIVAVTFTRKAAGELKLRLRQELEKARLKADRPESKANLVDAISRLEEARISTIHGFCADLLRERPVEAGIDPDFKELSDEEAQRLFDRVFRVWIQQNLTDMPESLGRALARLATWKSLEGQSPLQQIRQEAWKLVEWRDFTHSSDLPSSFRRNEAIDTLVESVFELSNLSSGAGYRNDPLRNSLDPVRRLHSAVLRSEAVRSRDYDDLEAKLIDLSRDLRRDRRKGRGSYSRDLTREKVLEARERLIDELAQFKVQADAELATLLQGDLRGIVEAYEEVKRQSGALDFVDLLLRARDLIRNNRSVREHFQGKFTHIFVDEFQDTDPLQAEILLLLSADDPGEQHWSQVSVRPGKLFIVGDPKQSIYRFRRADVQLYQKVKETLRKSGVDVLFLSRNFRSRRPLQQTVNAAFSQAIREDPRTGQPAYFPLTRHLPASENHPSVIALPVPEPYGAYGVTKTAVAASEPAAIASFVEWLLSDDCGWKIRDPENDGEESAIRPRHVCILFRRFISWREDVTRPYVRALDARGIPHLLVGSRTFHQREEVETLRAALVAVEWPEDELAVYATLRGSLFSVPDSLLFRFQKEVGRLHPFRKLPENLAEDFQPVVEGLSLLAQLARRRNDRPFVETLNELLEFNRAHAGFALRPSGTQVLANVQRVCDLARNYELSGGISFRSFVEFLNQEADKPRSGEAPILEDATEGVRIMTLHSAKGLESPVVILADITCALTHSDADKFVDHEQGTCALRILGCSPAKLVEEAEQESLCDQAEGIRIAYVAATRARDILVIPAVGDCRERIDGWISPLDPAIYPASDEEPGVAPNCPSFGNSSVLTQPYRLHGSARPSIRPGLHRPQSGDHEVVWWDPTRLNLKVEPDFGLRQFDILTEDESGEAVRSGMKEYQTWQENRLQMVLEGSVPGFRLLTPSKHPGEGPPESDCEVSMEILERPADRPSGTRFGTLVHTVLRDIPLGASRADIESLTRLQSRLLKATDDELNAAVETTARVLDHPLLRRAERSIRCHRELPVVCSLGDGRMLEGVIDLAFMEDQSWVVVDFKTDAHLDDRRSRYAQQIRWYAAALRQVSGLPAFAWLLGI